MAVGAVAQEIPTSEHTATVDDVCPMDSLPPLNKKEQKELRQNLDGYIDMWKTIGPSGKNPKLIFKDMDDERIVFEAKYELDDSSAQQLTSNYQWLRVSALYDATRRLGDIFGMAARLGMNAVVHANITLPSGNQEAFATFDNATLRRVIAMKNPTEAYIYADMITIRQKAPILIDDSMICTNVSFCNNLYTMNLHSIAADDPSVSSQFFWMIYNKWFIENNRFFSFMGLIGTTLRIVGTEEGNDNIVTLDYSPEQLLGTKPAIDVDLAGQYLAMAIGRNCPQTLDDSIGVWTHCSYDPTLKVVVMHYTVEELSILGVEGKEHEMKDYLLDIIRYADGAEFLDLLINAEVGLELRWQSRTTGRKFNVTYTTDELMNYLAEE